MSPDASIKGFHTTPCQNSNHTAAQTLKVLKDIQLVGNKVNVKDIGVLSTGSHIWSVKSSRWLRFGELRQLVGRNCSYLLPRPALYGRGNEVSIIAPKSLGTRAALNTFYSVDRIGAAKIEETRMGVSPISCLRWPCVDIDRSMTTDGRLCSTGINYVTYRFVEDTEARFT